jgi:iron complex outermembrane receptor protein
MEKSGTPAYTLLSTGIGANVKAFNRKDFMNIYISTENLTDVAYTKVI